MSDPQVNKRSPRPSFRVPPLRERSAFKIDPNDSWLVLRLFV